MGDMSFDGDLIEEVGPALAFWIGKWTATLEGLRSDSKDFRDRTADDMKEIKKRLSEIETGDDTRHAKSTSGDMSNGKMTMTWFLEKVALPIIMMGGGALLGFILANLEY